MVTRSFTVFKDTPASGEPAIVSKPVRASSRVLARSATKSTTTSNHLPGSLNELAVAIDKENYDPLTGLRASATVPKGEKLKRKTSTQGSSVLALKAHASAATATKKLKTSNISNGAIAEPEAKKRKTLTASTAASRAKVKTVTTKEGSELGSSKLPTRSTSSSIQGRKTKRTSPTVPLRKVPAPLPKVDEEGSLAGKGTSEPMPQPKLTKTLSQAAIDSRCYELTVSPLADVSEAYDASPLRPESEETTKPKTSKSKPEEDIFRTVREPSAEPELLRDYFTVDSFNAVSASSRVLSRLSEEPEERQKQSAASLFSTPERQKLYMSFTFSSPSPSGKRFRDTYGSYGSKQGSPTRSNVKAPGLLSPVAESPVATRV